MEGSFFRNIILQLIGSLGLELVNSEQEYFICIFLFSFVCFTAASLKRYYLCPPSNACGIFKRNHFSVIGGLFYEHKT